MRTKHWSSRTLAVGSIVAGLATVAAAQSGNDLAPKLDRLKQAAQNDAALSPELKSAINDVADELKKKESAPASAGDAFAKAFEKFRFNGDFRLRHESDFHLDDMESRNRERIRLRLGAEYDVNEQIAAGARLATGSPTDENSPHQNLGATFDKFAFNLDRAYVAWKPAFLSNTSISAGKFGHPFETNPVFAELVWDADVQPNGVVAGWKHAGAPGLGDASVVFGEYILLDNSTNGTLESAWAWVAQASARQKLNETNKLSESVGVYRYQRLNPDDVNAGRLFGENNGNLGVDTTGDGVADDYASRFTIYNPILAVENSSLSQPVTFAGELVFNPRARNDSDTGYALGVKVGRNKTKGDWQLYYQWQVMEQDAVLSNFTNDDFLFGTNYRGHLFGARLQLLEKTELHLWGSAMRRDDLGSSATTDNDKIQWRVRADLNFRF